VRLGLLILVVGRGANARKPRPSLLLLVQVGVGGAVRVSEGGDAGVWHALDDFERLVGFRDRRFDNLVVPGLGLLVLQVLRAEVGALDGQRGVPKTAAHHLPAGQAHFGVGGGSGGGGGGGGSGGRRAVQHVVHRDWLAARGRRRHFGRVQPLRILVQLVQLRGEVVQLAWEHEFFARSCV